jgi:transmembrane sensor
MTAELYVRHAIRAWTRRHSGAWRENDEKALQAWLAENAEHRAAYEKVGRAWVTAGGLQHDPTYEGAPPSRFIATKIAVAACIALLALGVGIAFSPAALRWWNGPEVSLATAKGQTKSFTLEDGTSVFLDADSQLVAHIGYHSRRASLVRGEALINVARDPARPFEVALGAGRIRDLGTRFDIETLPDSNRIAVLEGRVVVLTERGQALLVAGQSSDYDSTGNFQPVRSFDVTAVQWSQGRRHFDREPLGDVLERLTRYHAVTFAYTDAQLKNLRVSGTFRTDDQELFLRTLAAALPIELKYIDPGKVEISPRAADHSARDVH